MDGMGTPNRLGDRFAETEVTDFALLNQLWFLRTQSVTLARQDSSSEWTVE
jgi:hypothetical protein